MTFTTTVVVCAYTVKRWPDIVAGVEALARQTTPADEVLLVVDHNEELRELAERELPALLNTVTVLASSGPNGLSGARNSGIAKASGEVVAFLDDDARPEAGWLDLLVAPFADRDVMVTGGRPIAAWPGERPKWFPEEFDWVVGSAYRGMPTETADVRNVIGASMAVRRSAFEMAGIFTDGVGRVDTVPLGCEETELCIRFRREISGARVVYAPASIVHHRVSDDRLELRYFARRCFAEGLSKAQISRMVGNEAATATERTYVGRVLPTGVTRGLVAGLRGDRGGPQRAVAIVAGLALTVFGYAWQKALFLRGR